MTLATTGDTTTMRQSRFPLCTPMPYNTSDKSFLGRITQGIERAERSRPSGASIAGTSQHVAERAERQAKDTTGDTTNPARAGRRLGRVGV